MQRAMSPTGIVAELRRSHVALLGALGAMLVMTLLSSGYLLAVTEPAVVRYTGLAASSRLMHQAMLNQETGLRGWVATGDDLFLAPLEDGRVAAAEAGESLLRGTSRDPELTGLVVDTMLARQAWQTWADGVVAGDIRLSKLTPAATTATLLDGKELFDAYRDADLRATGAVVERRNEALADQRTALHVAMGSSLVTVAGAALFAARRRRHLTRAVIEPVAEVLTTIDALRGGDLGARVPATGVTELDAMGSALGELAAELHAAG
ncbi:CHASE3 domain-containing protein, partial [Actinotalea ferrariae]|uniref:CHASE3 domain-containing protein n=1 Tax=Actinotalea ferrariae TaxID=1386098 RepID=UPI001C8C2372